MNEQDLDLLKLLVYLLMERSNPSRCRGTVLLWPMVTAHLCVLADGDVQSDCKSESSFSTILRASDDFVMAQPRKDAVSFVDGSAFHLKEPLAKAPVHKFIGSLHRAGETAFRPFCTNMMLKFQGRGLRSQSYYFLLRALFGCAKTRLQCFCNFFVRVLSPVLSVFYCCSVGI